MKCDEEALLILENEEGLNSSFCYYFLVSSYE